MTGDDRKPLGRLPLRQVRAPRSSRYASTPETSPHAEASARGLERLAETFGVPAVDLEQVVIELSLLRHVNRDIALARGLLPLNVVDDQLLMAMTNPRDRHTIDEIEFVTGYRILPCAVDAEQLRHVTASAYDAHAQGEERWVGERADEAAPAPLAEPVGEASAPAASGATTGSAPPLIVEPRLSVPPRGELPGPDVPNPEFEGDLSMPQPGQLVSFAPAPLHSITPAAPPSARVPPFDGLELAVDAPLGEGKRNVPAEFIDGSALKVSSAGFELADESVGASGRSLGGNAPPAPRGRAAQRSVPEVERLGAPVSVRGAVVPPPLPARAPAPAPEAELPPPPGPAPTTSDAPQDDELGGLRPAAGAAKPVALVVDDDDGVRSLIVRALEASGFSTLEASRGKQALAMIREAPPDVLVLDAMLPEVHGFEIARRINGSERYGHIPIVMVTAVYRGDRLIDDLRESYGVEACFERPFRVSALVATVRKSLVASQKRRQAAKGAAETKQVDPEALSQAAQACLAQSMQAYRGGDVDGAIAALKRGTSIDPLAFRLHVHLGLLYGKTEMIFEAIGALEKALELVPTHFVALKNLALLYERGGFRHRALEVWKRALEASEDEDVRTQIKARLIELL